MDLVRLVAGERENGQETSDKRRKPRQLARGISTLPWTNVQQWPRKDRSLTISMNLQAARATKPVARCVLPSFRSPRGQRRAFRMLLNRLRGRELRAVRREHCDSLRGNCWRIREP